ncbi:MAG TPA: hypothetical protein VER12_01125 [Polyangiaceae bacterium]|nr:hypothetical protein [Polyangiaceae bacterium]
MLAGSLVDDVGSMGRYGLCWFLAWNVRVQVKPRADSRLGSSEHTEAVDHTSPLKSLEIIAGRVVK